MKPDKPGPKKRRVKPPRLVKGDRPHIIFYARDADAGRSVRVRIYAPPGELRPHALSRWRYRTIATVVDLLEAGYTYRKGSPGPIPLVSPAGEWHEPEPPRRTPAAPGGMVAGLEWALRSKALEVRPRTVETYGTVIGHVRCYLEEAGVPHLMADRFDKAHAAALSDHLLRAGVKGVTRNNYYQTLRSLFNRMRESGLASPNPFQAFRRVPEVRTGRNTAMQPAHVEALLRWMEGRDPVLLLVVRLIYWTFCRPVEVLRLLVSDVGPDCSALFFRAEAAKNRRAASVPLPPGAAAMLRSHLAAHLGAHGMFHLVSAAGPPADRQAGENTFSERHRKALRAVGLDREGYNLYSWKHTGVCAAYDAGMSLMEIRDRCRHASIQQTEEYLRDLRRVTRSAPPESW